MTFTPRKRCPACKVVHTRKTKNLCYRCDAKKYGQSSGVKRGKYKKSSEAHCANCGSTEDLTIDHNIPLAEGGRDDTSNASVTLCRTCNARKGRKLPWEWKG